MALIFNALSYPLLLRVPRWQLAGAARDSRLPLFSLVVALVRPRVLVEIGTGQGETFAVMCQAVQELGLPTQAVSCQLAAPEPGSPAAGLTGHLDAHYGSFARLVGLPAAPASLAYGPVDLLHLGAGLSEAETADALRAWQPHLSARAVVLMSAISPGVPDDSRGCLWSELKQHYPHFELLQGEGVGLLAVGSEQPEALLALIQLPAAELVVLRDLLFRLGSVPQAVSVETGVVARLERRLAEREAAVRGLERELSATTQTLRDQTALADQHQARLDQVLARESEMRALYLDLHQQMLARDEQAHQSDKDAQLAARDQALSQLRYDIARYQSQIHHMQGGRIWRLMTAYWQARYRLLSILRRLAPRA